MSNLQNFNIIHKYIKKGLDNRLFRYGYFLSVRTLSENNFHKSWKEKLKIHISKAQLAKSGEIKWYQGTFYATFCLENTDFRLFHLNSLWKTDPDLGHSKSNPKSKTPHINTNLSHKFM